MDFLKIMKISIVDIGVVSRAEQLYAQAQKLMEQLEYTPKEAKVAKDLVAIRQKALDDFQFLKEKYQFLPDTDEIVLEDNEFTFEKLVRTGNVVTWHHEFKGISGDPTQQWHGDVIIDVEKLFELYKAEYLNETMKEDILRDYRIYLQQCGSLAAMFHHFVNQSRAG